jgi:hypothetical protein
MMLKSIWCIMAVAMFFGADANSSASLDAELWSCTSGTETRSAPECLIAPEAQAHKQFCGKMAAVLAETCKLGSQSCKADSRRHRQLCEQDGNWKFTTSRSSPVSLVEEDQGIGMGEEDQGNESQEGDVSNYAHGRDVTASTNVDGWGGGLKAVTDGILTNDQLYSHSKYEINPWVQVSLNGDKQVAVIRTTFRGQKGYDFITYRNSGFKISVNDNTCVEEQGVAAINGPITMDSICTSELTGNRVRLSLPTGGKRFLMVNELEVYGPAMKQSGSCFNSDTKYPISKSCATCDGPGPSQCKTCNSGHAFVLLDNDKKTGSCVKYWSGEVHSLVFPGFAPVELSSRTQLYTKVAKQAVQIAVPRPETMHGVEGGVIGMTAICTGIKQIVCTKDLATGGSRCTQNKTGKFIAYGTDSGLYGGELGHGEMKETWAVCKSGTCDHTKEPPLNGGNYIDLFDHSSTEFINPCVAFLTLL